MRIMLNVPNYSQRNNAWASKKMAPSSLTLGQAGCLVTCVSMAVNNYAVNSDPGTACDALVKVNGFAPSGDLLLRSVEDAFPGVHYLDRTYSTNCLETNLQRTLIDAVLGSVKKLLRLGQPVPLWVDAVDHDQRADHWVLAVDWETDLLIHDPWSGDRVAFKDRYGDPYKAVYGHMALLGPPVSFPASGTPDVAQVAWKLAQAKNLMGPGTARQMVDEALQTLIRA